MDPFELVRLPLLADAQKQVLEDPVRYVFRAGGIDLIDRMKEGVDSPERLVELRAVSDVRSRLRSILQEKDGLQIGALVTLAELAGHGDLEGAFDAVHQAANEAATPGIRNTATVGGNLLQRPRCWYFRNAELVCLKKGGDVCLAVSGDNRYNAILGGGPSYIVHPSSLAAALMVCGATGSIQQADGQLRMQPLSELFALPSVDPQREHTLKDGEVLVDVTLPRAGTGTRSAYRAAREKQSHDWPLAEAAVSMRLDGGTMTKVRVALGHVAPVPWPSPEAEKVLEGKKPSEGLFKEAAQAALGPARPLGDNRYKIPLTQGVLRHALHAASGVALPE
jgi:xanthine dehydrogenase YagS FAD-binding subunit